MVLCLYPLTLQGADISDFFKNCRLLSVVSGKGWTKAIFVMFLVGILSEGCLLNFAMPGMRPFQTRVFLYAGAPQCLFAVLYSFSQKLFWTKAFVVKSPCNGHGGISSKICANILILKFIF